MTSDGKEDFSGRDLVYVLKMQDLVGAGQWEQGSKRSPRYRQKSKKVQGNLEEGEEQRLLEHRENVKKLDRKNMGIKANEPVEGGGRDVADYIVHARETQI